MIVGSRIRDQTLDMGIAGSNPVAVGVSLYFLISLDILLLSPTVLLLFSCMF